MVFLRVHLYRPNPKSKRDLSGVVQMNHDCGDAIDDVTMSRVAPPLGITSVIFAMDQTFLARVVIMFASSSSMSCSRNPDRLGKAGSTMVRRSSPQRKLAPVDHFQFHRSGVTS